MVPTVTSIANYNGLDFGQTAAIQANTIGGAATPPDPQGAVGPHSYVQAVNLSVAIYGPQTSGVNPTTDAIDDFFNFQGGLPDPNPSDLTGNAFSDPSVVFDQQTQRFIVSCMEIDPGPQFGSQFTGNNSSVYDFAVSKSNNPTSLTTADWNFYQVNTTETNEFSDYPGNIGYNGGALVVTLNEINVNTQATDHVLVSAINMSDVTNGVPQAKLHVYQSDYQGISLRPATMHDSTSANDPMWFVQEHPGSGGLGDGQHIDVVRMDNVLTSTPTYTTTTLAVNPYYDVSLVPPLQPDGSVVTPDLDSRILKVAEQNGLLVATHSVAVSDTEDDARWYVIDVSSGTPTMKEQGDISGGDNTYITYPAIDINPAGDIGMTYMQSGTDSPGDYLSMYVTGRTPTDPSGTMETPVLAQAGQQVYQDFGPANGSVQRAGDLSGINVDAQGNFWAVSEFADSEALPTPSTPSADWGTNITSFTLHPVADLNVTATGPATATPGGTATYTITLTNNGPNDAQNVVLTNTLPAGATNATIKAVSNPDGFSFTLANGVFTSGPVTVANGNQDEFTVTVTVPSTLIPGAVFDDSASVTSTTTDPNPYDNVANVIGSTGQSITISANYNAITYGQSAALLGGAGSTPPDNQGAVGPDSYVEAINSAIAIYNPRTSSANPVTDSVDDFFATQGGLPDPNPKDSFGNFLTDPFVVFDEQTQRFIIGMMEVDPGPQFVAQSTGNNSSVLDLAVSKSSNPLTLKTADWNFYQINTTEANEFSDYPGNVGYNGGALVVTLNEFNTTNLDQHLDHVLVNAINMSDLVNGVPQANLHYYQSDFQGGSLRPTTMHDSTSANDPMWFVQEHPGSDGLGDGQHIDVVRMDNVLSSNPTFTTTTLAVNPYSQVVAPLQPDGSMVTPALDSRIMKVAEQSGTLVAAQAVSNAVGNQDLVQWYRIDVSSGTPVLRDQGDVGSGPNTYLYFPGIDINKAGDIGMSYIQSGTDDPNDFMSMYITGRTPTDPAGTMEAPVLAQAGQQVYEDYAPAFAAPQRAGDLSGINVDSQGNFWAINEFADDEALPTSPDNPVADPNNPAADWATNVVSFALPATVTNQFGDPGFETPNVGTGSWHAFVYNPSGSPWTYSSSSGVTGNRSGFTDRNPNAPQGTQVAFLQELGTMSQVVNFTAGSYAISFYAAQRYGQASSQKFEVEVDGTVVGTFTPTSTTYGLYTTNSFTVTAGAHTVEFIGLDPSGGDNTALIDDAFIQQPATNQLNDPGFETPKVGTGSWNDYARASSGSPWLYTNFSGVAGNGSGFTNGNPNAPQGTQVAFLQDYGTMSQVVNFTAGTYAISFYAAQRRGQSSSQKFEVTVDGTVVGTFTPTSTTYGLYTTNSFTVTAGTHTIEFIGLDPSGGDNTAFVDDASIQQPATNQFNDPGFETPNVGTGAFSDFARAPSGSPWLYSVYSGVAGNGSGFTDRNPAAPQGTQVAFLQDYGTMSQVVNFTAGTYAISFYAAQRYGQASSQKFEVTVDGTVVGTFTPSGTTYKLYTTNNFTVTAGTHTIEFIGLDPNGGDNTTLIDDASI